MVKGAKLFTFEASEEIAKNYPNFGINHHFMQSDHGLYATDASSPFIRAILLCHTNLLLLVRNFTRNLCPDNCDLNNQAPKRVLKRADETK